MLTEAQNNIQAILSQVIHYSPSQKAMIVADSKCTLAVTLAQAYRRCIPEAVFIDFDAVAPENILTAFQSLSASDLVVLIQSTSFRLEAFRIRVELFNRSLKVIEHPHLAAMRDEEAAVYIDSLSYDAAYYRRTGRELKERLDRAKGAEIESGGERLLFSSGFEPAKLNTGDYSGMKNTGGQFPIGEVFTEAKNLEALNGRVRIFAFGDSRFLVNKPPKPITLCVTKGRVTEVLDSVPEFDRVLARIREDEGEIWVRELGFGLNRALTQARLVSDIGTYERMCGVHLSLGAKHSLYKKPAFTRKDAKHHVDVFVAAESVLLDGETVYQNKAWRV